VSCKKVLIVRTSCTLDLIPPLGALHVASAIRNAETLGDYSIKIVDCVYDRLDDESFVELLGAFAPDFIMFSSLDSEFPLFKKLCTLSRQSAPDSTVVAGGILATNYHEEIVERQLADITVRGEGEITVVELLGALENGKPLSGVEGITFRERGKAVTTPPRKPIEDLDSISRPAWDLIDLRGYSKVPSFNGGIVAKYYAPVMTSRGCAFNCIYCHNLFGRKMRGRSVDHVLSEIQMLYQEYGIREIHFIDDLFNYDLKRVRRICKAIVDCGLELKISFPNGLRADRMDQETLDWLKRAGTYKINYAIETASPRLQRLIKKNLNLEKASHWIDETSKLGIITFGYFMFGFPTETVDEMESTIAFAVGSKLDTARLFKATVFKNTALEELRSDQATTHLDELERSGGDVFHDQSTNCSDISTEALNRIVTRAHRQFFFQKARMWRILAKYGPLEGARKLYTMHKYVTAKERENEGSWTTH
jgi:anaerobic magnesium-protoporphyrin IX monomethyl ester cyclase